MSEPRERRTALFRRAVARGWRRQCPHCGIGPLFAGRWRHLERCAHCGLVFERNPGDTWAFTVIGDRLPIAAIIAVIFFGVVRQHLAIGTLSGGPLRSASSPCAGPERPGLPEKNTTLRKVAFFHRSSAESRSPGPGFSFTISS
jgi:hypothetical protein